MGSAAQGQINVALENISNPGAVPLMAATNLAATITGYIQPSTIMQSSGMRLECTVLNNTTTGNITISGTSPTGASISDVWTGVAIPPVNGQSPEVVASKFTTNNVYSAITSITSTSGLYNGGGQLRLSGLQSGKYPLPCTFKFGDKRPTYSPLVHNGLINRDVNIQQLLINCDFDLSMPMFPDSCVFWGYQLFGAPVSTVTIPASPDSLLASTAVASTMPSLTTQPKLPGEVIIFVLTGSAVAGTITIAGTNNRNQPVAGEVITTNGAGTYYSSNIYTNVSAITTTGMTGGSLTVTGVFGWKLIFNDALLAFYTACYEFYTGTESRSFPFAYFDSGEWDMDTTKEVTLTAKGMAQAAIPIGDRTTSPMTGSRLASLALPTDQSIVGWQSLCWIDPLGTTPQTTAFARLLSLKVGVAMPKEAITPATNTQRFSSVYPKKDGREVTVDGSIDMIDLSQYEAWRKGTKQVFSLGVFGPFIGNSGGTSYQKQWLWTLPMKYVDDGVAPESDPGKANVSAAFKGKCEYEPSLGYGAQLTIITQQAPVYPL